MRWKTFVSDYFTFSKKDRMALLCFSGATILIYSLSYIFPKTAPAAIQEDTVLSKLLDTAVQLAAKQKSTEPQEEVSTFRYEVSKKPDFIAGEVFPFDPNTLDAAGWKALGLENRTVKTILNYRSKGGRFYKGEDLKKIWGLPDGFYEHVQGHIQIKGTKGNYETNPSLRQAQDGLSPVQAFSKSPYEKQNRTIAAVDVNSADTTALIRLPGIGSKLAQRIISFRNKLGGFHSADQIGETYGLPDSTFQILRPYLQVHGEPKKFNINTATKDELKAHPYIKWHLANAIVEYRTQHGGFKRLEDVKNITLIDEGTYTRIAPYLSL